MNRRKVRIRRRRLPSTKTRSKQTSYRQRQNRKPDQRRRKKKRKGHRTKASYDYLLTPQYYDDERYDEDDRSFEDGVGIRNYRRPLSATLGYDPDGTAYIRYINKRKLDLGKKIEGNIRSIFQGVIGIKLIKMIYTIQNGNLRFMLYDFLLRSGLRIHRHK